MKSKGYILFGLLIGSLILLSIPEYVHTNSGQSKAYGTRANGRLENAYLLPYFGKNFSYFSPLSYFIANNAYCHHKTYHTLLDAYAICEKTCPNVNFTVMECSDKFGGKLAIHRTHQHGLSVDFMVPKIQKGSPRYMLDYLGYMHYLLDFDDSGHFSLQKSTQIDFETMAKHILAVDDAARKNGLRIKMVILKIELKDDFFKTKSGQKVKNRNIYFARSLPYWTNRVHDDHYHIDFEIQ